MHDLVEPPASVPPAGNAPAIAFDGRRKHAAHWLYVRLAFQNLLRRPARSLLLVLAVSLSVGAVFSSLVVGWGVKESIAQSFARMGADLVVVPEKAMVNITSSLLTVQPTELLLDQNVMDEVRRIDGVCQVAPQTIVKVPIMAGMPNHKANLIAFDPKLDFTVLPWLDARMDKPFKTGDLISGGRRSEDVGEEVQPCNIPATIYGKLARSGVGPFDESFFATYETLEMLERKSEPGTGSKALSKQPGASGKRGISALLVRLDFGATPEQVKFSIARLPGVKVITGTRVVTATRETTTILLFGMLAFSCLMLVADLLLVSLLFSGIIAERTREIGLLRAIGAGRGKIAQMLLAEAGFATGFGGIFGVLLGVALIAVFQNSLVFYLKTMHVDFAWPPLWQMGAAASACALIAASVGIAGAMVPALRAAADEPYRQIQGEGA